MKKIFICSFMLLCGCTTLYVQETPYVPSKNDVNDYAYVESAPAVEQIKKSEQEKLTHLQKEAILLRQTTAREITYSKSEEEKIEKLANQYIERHQWKMALNTLIKYEPILTHNKNLSNQLIFVSLKLDYYDFAIDQLLLALQQKHDIQSEKGDYLDKQVILAHAYYLSDKYKQAEGLYTELYKSGKYPEAARHLFLLGYKQKNLNSMNQYLAILGKEDPQFIYFTTLAAQVEQDSGQAQIAAERMEQLFIDRSDYVDQTDLTLQYAHTLIQTQQFPEALKVLDAPVNNLSNLRQYHFMKAYVYFQQGQKQKFQKHLASSQIEERYKKDLASLLLNQSNYTEVYAKIFQKDEIEEYKMSQTVKRSAEKYTYKYINKPQFKDAVLVREEFRPVTEPLRLPASLEFDESK